MIPPRALRILLVDDNFVNQKIARKLFEQLGYACDIAVSGGGCLERCRQQPYALIFLDIGMPDMDGYETLRRLREWEEQSGAPPADVIALTAFNHAEDRARSLAAGMRDHLTKPLKKDLLRQAIDSHLQSAVTTALR